MSKILIPANSADDWKQFLAEPDKQWKSGYSARSLAHCWQDADGMPVDVKQVLEQEPQFKGLETLIAVPEHKVPLPGGSTESQNDVWVLARTGSSLVSIAVEGKVSEPFGDIIDKWRPDSTAGKRKRMDFLCRTIGLEDQPPGDIRYQLLHRTASAIIEAKRFHAQHAVMLVHSFSQTEEWFPDYEKFLSLYGIETGVNRIVSAGELDGIKLHFAWVRGDAKYLSA
jgi:hypothetical protein